MSTSEKHQGSVCTVSNDNDGFVNVQSNRNPDIRSVKPKSKMNRKVYMIIGAVIVVVIIAAVAVTVPVVLTHKSNEDESSKQKTECGPYSYPGINISSLTPRIISDKKTCPLKGDCWTGEQCYQCFKLRKWKVANINNIPVCCANCEISGLAMSSTECRCRHNGG